MAYLLDTNICIYLLNNRYPQLNQKLASMNPDEVVLSSIVASELRYGAENSSKKAENHKTLDFFLSAFEVLDYDAKATDVYGQVRSALKNSGSPIGAVDTFIAAHALSENLILVTNNIKQFEHVLNLKLENWINL
ncbi:MAG: type II toxin-antitoxin system VapC family toxin [Chloroflexota bacterium]